MMSCDVDAPVSKYSMTDVVVYSREGVHVPLSNNADCFFVSFKSRPLSSSNYSLYVN